MLRIENLSKRYGDHLVFEGLNLHLSPGCYALCEEDNTGKSTLLKIIAGELAADSGAVWIDGLPLKNGCADARLRLAYIPENCLIHPSKTGRQLLEEIAHEKQVVVDATVLEFAEHLGLTPHLDKPFEQMSTGTRRKVYLAAATLGNPAVIAADGPSDGLDAPARRVLADAFKAWGKNRVVLFASHDAELVDACGARKNERLAQGRAG